MSKQPDGGPAFPRVARKEGVYGERRVSSADGMSLRDWFAGQALAGLLASGPHDCEAPGVAHDAYLHADAMLAAREQEPAP